MENREFIPATDLPITEAENVDVLCVESGEMKRKPAKGLNGIMLTINMTVSAWHTMTDSPVFDHTYEEIKAALDKGMFVRCVARKTDWSNNGMYRYTNEYYKIMNVVHGTVGGENYVFCIPYQDSQTYDGSMNYYIKEDGTTGYTDNH